MQKNPVVFLLVIVLLSTVSVWGEDEPPDLYKRLGGYDAIAAVTDDFIARLSSDPSLQKFFVGHSSESLMRIRQMVVSLICMATGGPCYYIGRDIKSSHAGLGITESDWDISVKHLMATLDKFKVPEREREEFLAIVAGLKSDVVDEK